MEFEKATLLNLAEGAAKEKFDFELQRVIENIQDLNTDPSQKREVILKVVFVADKERKKVSVEVSAKSKLAADVPATDMIHLTRDGAVVPPMRQMSFDEVNAERDDAVSLFDKEKGEAN